MTTATEVVRRSKERQTRAAALNGELLRLLIERLTERDRLILRLLREHTVLTSSQIRDAAFPSVRITERRMLRLYLLRAVDRVRPRVYGEYHWILDDAGAEALAAELDVDVKALGWNQSRVLRTILHGQRCAHLVGVNGFFTALLRTARESGGRSNLASWWPEARCAAEGGRYVRPDAFGEWNEQGARVRFLLEYDRGTECSAQLLAKLPGYTRLAQATEGASRWWLLFRFHSERRELSVRRALERGTPIRNIATAALAKEASAADCVWLPLADHRRRTLRELGMG
jgi:hypothetical protein